MRKKFSKGTSFIQSLNFCMKYRKWSTAVHSLTARNHFFLNVSRIYFLFKVVNFQLKLCSKSIFVPSVTYYRISDEFSQKTCNKNENQAATSPRKNLPKNRCPKTDSNDGLKKYSIQFLCVILTYLYNCLKYSQSNVTLEYLQIQISRFKIFVQWYPSE